VKTLSRSFGAPGVMRRVDRHRCAGAFLLVLLLLAMFAMPGNVVPALAQSQTTAKPAASPETAPVQKPGVNESTLVSPATGTIKGRVVSDDGRPVTNATLIAQAVTGAPAAKPGRVDSEGRFVFDDLPPAAYVVIAIAPGYIDESLATGDPSQWPRHLIGAQLKITMIKGGVITGTVTNSKGDPVVGVPVHASLVNGLSSSVTDSLGGGSLAESDDRGIYRIYGLLPGQYTVNAGGSGQFGLFAPSGFDLDVPTYYPSSTRDTAVPVSVRSGDATTGIDIKYRGAEGHSISGVVLGTVDASAATGAIAITLSHAATQSILSLTIASTVDQRRVFSFHGVADGEYDLFAGFQSPGQNDAALVATKRVTVRGGDVTGIELTLASLASIAGTMTLDPIKPEDKCDRRASQLIEALVNAPRDEPKKSGSQVMTSMFAGFGGTMNAKGEFTMRNLEAGRYRFEIKLPTEAWYVRAINLAATAAPPAQPSSAAKPSQSNAWQGVVTIKSGERLSGVSIMVGQDAAGLRGRVVVTPEGTAIPAGLRVHLVPANREQANNILRYSETTVNSDGSFKFTNLAPGRYFIVSRVEPPAESDAAPRPAAWDPITRAKLRREAEAAKTEVELRPCQAIGDYPLKLGAAQ
jgi:hypothetical protein